MATPVSPGNQCYKRYFSGLFILIWVLAFVASPAAAQGHLWSQRFGGSEHDRGRSIAFDASGNFFVTGEFRDNADFGGGVFSSAGTADIFLAKYDASGNHLWSKRFGGTNDDFGFSVAVDASGNVFLTGYFRNSVDFGGGVLNSVSVADVYLAKYDTNGNHLWSQSFGGSASEGGYSLAVDGFGNVFMTGFFANTVDFGGGGLTSAGSLDIFVAKYDGAGNHVWSQGFGDVNDDFGRGVAVDASGDVFVTGYFDGTVDFGGGGLATAGATDIFLAKYDASGTHLWSQRFGSTSYDYGRGIAVDGSGNVLVTGDFRGTVDFGGGGLVANNDDVFLAKYDTGGAHLWSQRFGGASGDQGDAVDVDNAGNVFLTGYFGATADFGGGGLTTAGFSDIFIAKYDPSGAHQWSAGFGGTNNDEGFSIVADDCGNPVVTGMFFGTADFGGGALTSAGLLDIFLARYVDAPVISSIVDVGNDQGRQVRITFQGSSLDCPGSATPIIRYDAFRRVDPLPSSPFAGAAAIAEPSGPVKSDETTALHALIAGWEFVGSVPAYTEETYNMIAPTLADTSVGSGQHWSVFFVRAATANPATFVDSDPDSGYSIDNLAPGVPASFLHNLPGILTWDPAPEADFDYYTVYGSNSDTFDGSAVFIGYTINTTMDVQASPYPFYHLTATDEVGNEGDAATVANVATGVHDTPRAYTLSVSAHPNPFNPATMITYTTPATGAVTLAIYDVEGRLVETLVENEHRERGEYHVAYNAQGATGVYFVRLETREATRTMKIVVLK